MIIEKKLNLLLITYNSQIVLLNFLVFFATADSNSLAIPSLASHLFICQYSPFGLFCAKTNKGVNISYNIIKNDRAKNTVENFKHFIDSSKENLLEDLIFVTCILGEAFAGLNLLKQKKQKLNPSEKKYLKRYLKPKIDFLFSQDLSKIANSCIDISDGLMADLNHICQQSNLKAEINLEKIPLIGNPIKAITWGDDYQLCFTISSSKSEKLAEISKKHKVKITNIGKLTKGKGVTVLLDGKKINIKKPGYNRFSE